MKLYIKGFYGYKNFGDEVILFGLLNFLQKKYNPEVVVVEVGDLQRIQNRINNNLNFLDSCILDKLEFVENAEISKRFIQFLSILGFGKYKKYFKVFGGGEVFDESRQFPHDGRNLLLLHHYCIKKGQFMLVGGFGTDKLKKTKLLFKKSFPFAKEIICREGISVKRVEKYGIKNVEKYQDFSKSIFENKKYCENLKLSKTILINISPKYFTEKNIQKIKDFVGKYDGVYKKIFFPADISFDKSYYSEIRKIIPELEIYDWTKHKLQETIDLFQTCEGGIGSRLHFLYPLKLFKKNFESLSNSDKIKKLIG